MRMKSKETGKFQNLTSRSAAPLALTSVAQERYSYNQTLDAIEETYGGSVCSATKRV